MLINALRADADLQPFIKSACCENDVCVDFDPAIPQNNYLIIKVDDFYNANVPNPDTPKSPDCLIVQRCSQGHFHVYVAELKNIQFQNAKNLNRQEIWDKMHTCLTDFMSNRFRQYFYDLTFDFDLKLVLVAGKVTPAFTRNFEFNFLLSLPWLRFGNKLYGIEGQNPNMLVRPC